LSFKPGQLVCDLDQPGDEGLRSRHDEAKDRSAQRSEEGPHVLDELLRSLERSKVAAV
jgi:hypothetical protein